MQVLLQQMSEVCWPNLKKVSSVQLSFEVNNYGNELCSSCLNIWLKPCSIDLVHSVNKANLKCQPTNGRFLYKSEFCSRMCAFDARMMCTLLMLE